MAKSATLKIVDTKGNVILPENLKENVPFTVEVFPTGFTWKRGTHTVQFYRDGVKGRKEGTPPLVEWGDTSEGRTVATANQGNHTTKIDCFEGSKKIFTKTLDYKVLAPTSTGPQPPTDPFGLLLPQKADLSVGFGLIPFESFGGDFKKAQAWWRALYNRNTGRLTPRSSKSRKITTADLKSNTKLEDVYWEGTLKPTDALDNCIIENFDCDGGTYCIRGYDAYGCTFRWGTLFSVESAMVLGQIGLLERIECEGTGSDVLKLEGGRADLIWGYHTGKNEGSHADFNQNVAGDETWFSRCYADCAKVPNLYRSNSFFQYQDGAKRVTARHLVTDGFNRIFNVDSEGQDFIGDVFTFGTSQYGMGGVNGTKGKVFSAITGKELAWESAK